MAEPLQVVPLLNLSLHWAVLLLAAGSFLVSVVVWHRLRAQRSESALEWGLIASGLFFFAVSEYSDLYTPGLKASLGVHNYLTEHALLVGLVFLFIALRRIVVRASGRA